MNAVVESPNCWEKLSDVDFTLLTPQEQMELESLLVEEVETGPISLKEFVQEAWPLLEPMRPMVWGFHLDAICEHLEAVTRGQIANLVIEIPPGTGKSTVISVLWPAWEWTLNPSVRFLTASYALALAMRDAVRSRRVITSAWYQRRWGRQFRLTGDQNLKGRYENDHTGYRIALSIGSGTTGERADRTLVDDPHNVTEAESLAVRLGTLQWHNEAFWNRINDAKRGGRVVVGQRVAVNDLIGHLLESGDEWCELRIPERFEVAHRCETALPWADPRVNENDLMRSERMSEEQLKKEEKRLGSVAFAAQYQQRPVPREGALFKKDWLTREFMDLGDGYKVGDFYYPYSDCWHMVIVDPAGGESQAADFTAIGTFAVTPRNDMLVVDMVRDRIPLEEIQREVLKACQKRQLDVEFVGWEIGFFQTKMAKVAAQIPGMPPLKAIDPGGKSKFVRAIPAIVLAESGLLYLPEDTDWLEEFKKELLRFTGNNDPHDDQVDCLAMASQQRQLRENHSDAQPFSFGRPSQNYGRRY